MVETVVLKRKNKIHYILNIINKMVMGYPPDVAIYDRREMREKINSIIQANNIDIVQIDHMMIATYEKNINKCIKVVDLPDVEFNRYKGLTKIACNRISKLRYYVNYIYLKNWEAKYLSRFNMCFVTSQNEKKLLMERNRKLRIEIIPNGVECQGQNNISEDINKDTILFVGSLNYEPNIDALKYFHNSIQPIYKEAGGNCRFVVVGSNPNEDVINYINTHNIKHYYDVIDIKEYYKKAIVSVVPIRYGGGTRLKILESMAFGCPVVSTSVGCEGIEATHQNDIIIADNPSEFAMSIIRLISDKELLNRIRNNGKRLVEEKYSWDIIAKKISIQYEMLIR